jgi:uncharacterized protein YggE
MNKKWLAVITLLVTLAVTILAGCTTAPTSSSEKTNTQVTTTLINTVTTTSVIQPDVSLEKNGEYLISNIITEQQVGIIVNGAGTVTVVPDIVKLNLGVRSQETTVAAAQVKAAAAMDQIMSVLKENNIAEKDIQTVQFNIGPVYSYNDTTGQNVIIGYSVNNIISVKIRDLDDTGKIIDAVAIAGGDLTVINSISFTVDNPEQYYTEARQKAMTDAQSKAQQLATLGGVTLGKPIYVTESSIAPSQIFYTKTAEFVGIDSPTQISAGETDIIINVSVIYSIS